MRNGLWADAPHSRDQIVLISPSLDDMIPADHRVRIFEEVLEKVDWSDWEREYDGVRGQPPIHPRFIAGTILYGLVERIRSSRELEKATRLRMDFVWFLHGRSIDHSTLSSFRTRFKDRLQDLFKQLAQIALEGRLEVALAVDGTRIRSNSSRNGALAAESIEKRAEQITVALTEALEKLEKQDMSEESGEESADELRRQVALLTEQRDRLAHALKEAQQRDEVRSKRRSSSRSRPARVPVSDPDSYILKNKEGGYAPNYTPTAAVETSSGVIVSADIPPGEHEAITVESTVEDTIELTGNRPERILFDNTFATGHNLKDLAEKGIETYSSTRGNINPVHRSDLSQPVLEDAWGDLPAQKKNGKTLTRDAFIYDKENDCYWCPMGQSLGKLTNGTRQAEDRVITYTQYRTSDCSDCPLATRCLSRTAKRRTLIRDEFEDYREDLQHRMQTQQAREIYRQRAPVVEGTFAQIKHNMGIRQFLHRGMKKVRMEWLWICAAFNVMKILKQPANA